MNAKPAQKTVLITGCSEGGIGDALARSFYSKGFKVFASARNLSKISHLEAIGISVLVLDIVDSSSVSNAVEAIKAATGGTLDILVNNAGAGYSSPLLDADIEKSKEMFEVNVWGRVRVTQAFAGLLMSARGKIINIGSIAGYYPSVWQGMYGASCAAVHQWNDVLRIEIEPFHVVVILVVTRAIKSHFLDNLPTTRISDDSIYAPGKQAIEALMNGTTVRNNYTSAEVYADQVVKNAMMKQPKQRIWVGGVVTIIWAVSTFLWATAWDFLLAKQWGITDLKKKLR